MEGGLDEDLHAQRCGGGTEQDVGQMVGARQVRWGPELWAQAGLRFTPLVIGSRWVLYQSEPWSSESRAGMQAVALVRPRGEQDPNRVASEGQPSTWHFSLGPRVLAPAVQNQRVPAPW